MSSALELSVVIPAYREAEALTVLLPALKIRVAELTPASEILVIDTREALDDTEAVCKRHGVCHVRRRGGDSYGDAIRTAFQTASGERILVMDGDGSHRADQLCRLWGARHGAEVVIGSRYIRGGATQNPAILILLSWTVNLSYRIAFGLKCKDASNSLRLYRAETLRAVSLECNNFDIVEEILIKICRRCGASGVREVPITFETRKGGVSKRNLFVFAITYLWTIIRLLRLRN